MSTVYYPSIYDNTYKYAELANNSIVITTQSGFGAVAAAENTVIICNENGQWITSSLDNYATSSDISDLQNSIDTLSTYSDILQQSITSNLNAINTLQSDLTNNYFTKEEVTSTVDEIYTNVGGAFSMLDSNINTLSDEVSVLSTNLTLLGNEFVSLSNDVQILSEDIIYMRGRKDIDRTANGYDRFFARTTTKQLDGMYKLYGTVTLYISDITKLTPKVNNLEPEDWLDSLPIFEISFEDGRYHSRSCCQQIIEANNSLITIPVNVLIREGYEVYMQSNIILNEPDNINITVNDIYLYNYNLYLERVNREIFQEWPQE